MTMTRYQTRPRNSAFNENGLTLDDMRRDCPSIFAEHPHESRSDKYAHFPTLALIEQLMKADLIVTSIMQSNPRDESRYGHTKHLIRLRDRSVGTVTINTPPYREALIKNSSDGTTSLQLMNGLFRMVCTNGMVTGDIESDVRIPHKPGSLPRVVEATYHIIEEGKEDLRIMEEMKKIQLPEKAQTLLAEFAMAARYDVDPEDKDAIALLPYPSAQLLRPHRSADYGNDLWTVFQRVQENTIRPNNYVYSYDDQRNKRHMRNINGIDQNVKLNKMLWALSKRMGNLD